MEGVTQSKGVRVKFQVLSKVSFRVKALGQSLSYCQGCNVE